MAHQSRPPNPVISIRSPALAAFKAMLSILTTSLVGSYKDRRKKLDYNVDCSPAVRTTARATLAVGESPCVLESEDHMAAPVWPVMAIESTAWSPAVTCGMLTAPCLEGRAYIAHVGQGDDGPAYMALHTVGTLPALSSSA